MKSNTVSSSFRDPSGFVFEKDGEVYRHINKEYFSHYEVLMNSGLYDELIQRRLLIPHNEIESNDSFKTIKPEIVPYVSYPYEWSFSQYKDAALVTLKIQEISLKYGMTLKDASAYNIQFHKGAPILIDTLSFEILDPTKPWIAYRQFCQHFLAPLSLMSLKDIRMNCLMKDFIDGIPLDLADCLLPKFLNIGLFLNIRLHSRSQHNYSSMHHGPKKPFSKNMYISIVDGLQRCVNKFSLRNIQSEWANYYSFTNYDEKAFIHKRELVESFLKELTPSFVVDFGANNGYFSRLASNKGIPTVAYDIDPLAVEYNYLTAKKNNEKFILPLLCDLTNPSPGIGWENKERDSCIDRCKGGCSMALALIHHLAISNNLPFNKIVDFFYVTSHSLIIEFVPKEDSQVQKLLSTRKDIFSNYTEENFLMAFDEKFEIIRKELIKDSIRSLYLMKRK